MRPSRYETCGGDGGDAARLSEHPINRGGLAPHVLKVAPSILSADFSRLGDEVEAVAKAGADWIHLDVMDGRFVPNITFGPVVIESVRSRTNLPFEIHLMIKEPERYLEDFRAAGGDRMLIHAESTAHLHRAVHRTRELGAQVGVALNPSTPLEAAQDLLTDLDMLLVMTVNPGFGGQSFIETMLPKIRRARTMARRLQRETPLEILVDGGIKGDSARLVESAGATCAVAGSYVFEADDYRERIDSVRGQQGRLGA
jgi:ribulose-phosphate 3-epimerase